MSMKAWLKGGLIALGIDVAVFLIWWVVFFVPIVLLGKGSLMAGFALIAIPMYGLISLIPAFLIGALIGFVAGSISKGQSSSTIKGLSIGFVVGVITSVLFYISVIAINKASHPSWTFSENLADLFVLAPGEILIILSPVVIGIILGLIIGALRR